MATGFNDVRQPQAAMGAGARTGAPAAGPGAAAGMAVSFEESRRRLREDRARARGKNLALGACLLALCLASLCLGVSSTGLVYSPARVWGCVCGWFTLNVASFFDPSALLQKAQVLQAFPMYYEVQARAVYTAVTVVCGALLAVSGMLYQSAFRNPIAAPAMLGVSSGVTLGLVALVWLYGASATYMASRRYLFSFIGGLAVLLLVMGLGKLVSGRRPINLINMLLVGSIASSLLGTVATYITNYVFDDTQWLAFYDIENAVDLDATGFTLAALGVAAAVSMAPVVAMRFRLNCVAFSDDDMRVLGVNPNATRFVALAAGSLMILTAQAFCGAVSMVSLVVPFAARAVFGCEFRRQLLGNVLLGALARSVSCAYSRIQFTPDVMPSDITGFSVFNQKTREFEFRAGAVQANVVLADEVNRACAKTQSALLEAMEERQVSVDGATHALPEPFMVVATQNPVEQYGTYPLPEAQMDRFMVRLSVGYPAFVDEVRILRRERGARRSLGAVVSREEVLELQGLADEVHASDDVCNYIVQVVAATRTHPEVQLGCSPRSGLATLAFCRARALMEGRGYVTPDDVKAAVPHTLCHRIQLTSEARVQGRSAEQVLASILASIAVPAGAKGNEA